MEIEKFLNDRTIALKNKDVAKVIERYSENVISYDVVGDLVYHGIAALRKRLEEWLSTLLEINEYEITDVKSSFSQNTAFCSSLNHIDAITKNGKLDMWWRETLCFQQINGLWKITLTHSSVPFDPESGMASTELKPKAIKNKIELETSEKSPSELVKRLFMAFQNQEREVIDDLLHPDFVFSSPPDPKLNKEQYFEKCYPFSKRVKSFELLKVIGQGNEVFAMYKCSNEGLPDFINTEFFVVEGEKIKSVKVFFGDQ